MIGDLLGDLLTLVNDPRETRQLRGFTEKVASALRESKGHGDRAQVARIDAEVRANPARVCGTCRPRLGRGPLLSSGTLPKRLDPRARCNDLRRRPRAPSSIGDERIFERSMGRPNLSLFRVPSKRGSGFLASIAPLPCPAPWRRPSAVRVAASTSVICLPCWLPSDNESTTLPRPLSDRQEAHARREREAVVRVGSSCYRLGSTGVVEDWARTACRRSAMGVLRRR